MRRDTDYYLTMLLGLVLLVLTFCGCKQPRLGVSAGGLWSYHCTDDARFTKSGEVPALSIDTDMDDGWGLIGKFDIVGKLPEKMVKRFDFLENVTVGGTLDVTHTEVNGFEIDSLWGPHRHHGHSHSKRASKEEPVRTVFGAEVAYQTVTLAPRIGYDFGDFEPYIAAGPTAVFFEYRGDYYDAGSESDTVLGGTVKAGIEYFFGENVFLFTEYRYLVSEPSLYYIEGSKFETELEAHSIAGGIGGRF